MIMKENYFDKVAAHWGTPRQIAHTKIAYNKLLEILNAGEEHKGTSYKRALELGCGNGMLAGLLSPHFDCIDCIDSSKEMRVEFEKRLEALDNKHLTVYDESYLEETNKTYDIIYSLNAFHHMRPVSKVIRKIKNLVSSHGKICIMDLCRVSEKFHEDFDGFDGYHGFEENEIKTYFHNENINIEKYEIIYEGVKKGIEYKIFIIVGSL